MLVRTSPLWNGIHNPYVIKGFEKGNNFLKMKNFGGGGGNRTRAQSTFKITYKCSNVSTSNHKGKVPRSLGPSGKVYRRIGL